MRAAIVVIAMTWIGLWLTPDQQGQRLFRKGEFAKAAPAFENPQWRGAAWYRTGEFEQAAEEFARSSTPESQFNEGNAWLMLGKYDQAVASYERALKKRPDWKEARENRDLAIARGNCRQQQRGRSG